MSKYDFDYDNDDEEDEFDHHPPEDEFMAAAVYNNKAAWDAEMALAEKSILLELLDKSLFVARSSWAWWFLSHTSKVDRIEQVFERLKDAVK